MSVRHVPVTLALLVSACAPTLPMRPVSLVDVEGGEQGQIVRLEREVTVGLPTGYQRTLQAGTSWKRIGRIPDGDVFEPVDSVLTIEGRSIREAYLVVRDSRLVGFFMPVEDAFSALTDPVSLTFSR